MNILNSTSQIEVIRFILFYLVSQFFVTLCQWCHVDSVENLVDCVSRGVKPSKLVHLDLYWHGLPFVYNESSSWLLDFRTILPSELHKTSPVSLATSDRRPYRNGSPDFSGSITCSVLRI